MNHVRKAIVILDIKQLLRYMEFLKTKQRTNVCTLCCDDCNGSCLNRKYIPVRTY